MTKTYLIKSNDLKVQKDYNTQHLNLIAELNNKFSKFQSLEVMENAINKRKEEVEQKERDKKVFEAELKAIEAEKRSSELYGLVQMVFKSPVFRKNTYESDNYGSFFSNGQE